MQFSYLSYQLTPISHFRYCPQVKYFLSNLYSNPCNLGYSHTVKTPLSIIIQTTGILMGNVKLRIILRWTTVQEDNFHDFIVTTIPFYTLRSPIKLNATVTQLPDQTAWFSAKRYNVFPMRVTHGSIETVKSTCRLYYMFLLLSGKWRLRLITNECTVLCACLCSIHVCL